MSATFDFNTYCPACGQRHAIFEVIPNPVRTYTNWEREEVVERFGPLRDYTCRNCDHEWSMAEAQA